MDIVFDTNSLHYDYRLKGTAINKVVIAAKTGNHRVYIPEVVQREMEKHFKQDLENLYKEIDKGVKRYTSITGEKGTHAINDAIFKNHLRNYHRNLKKRMKDLGIHTLKLARNAESTLMNKAVNKKKPFKESGVGTPDVLIWQSIIAAAEKYSGVKSITSPRIIFVTNNSDDFCDKKTIPNLHPDLLNDLAELEIPFQVIKIVLTTEDAFELIYESSDEIIAKDIKNFISNTSFLKHDLYINLTKKIMDFLPGQTFEPEEVGLPDFYESPTIDMFYEDFYFEQGTVQKLSDEDISIDWDISVTCLLDIFVPKSELGYIDKENAASVYDYNWNDHYAAAQIEKKIWFTLAIITNEKLETIESFEMTINEERNTQREN